MTKVLTKRKRYPRTEIVRRDRNHAMILITIKCEIGNRHERLEIVIRDWKLSCKIGNCHTRLEITMQDCKLSCEIGNCHVRRKIAGKNGIQSPCERLEIVFRRFEHRSIEYQLQFETIDYMEDVGSDDLRDFLDPPSGSFKKLSFFAFL